MRRSLCIALCLAAAVCAAGIPAQTAPHGPAPQIGKPISLVTEQKTVQTFAEGLQITRVTRESYYRDSKGRMLTKSENPLYAGGSYATITIQDPAANETFFWNTLPGTSKEYTESTLVSTTPSASTVPYKRSPASVPVTKQENLGEEYVEGFPCHAVRRTTTYPVDMVGNDRPFVVVNETCQSSEFGRALKSSSDDPRNGKTTLTVISISRDEPDPALFQPPADYVRRIGSTSAGMATVVSVTK